MNSGKSVEDTMKTKIKYTETVIKRKGIASIVTYPCNPNAQVTEAGGLSSSLSSATLRI